MLFGWYQLRQGAPPYPSLADALYLRFALPALGALIAFTWATPHVVSRARTVLDGLVIAACLLFVSWASVLGTLFRSVEANLAWITSLAYPVVDVTVAAVVIALGLRRVSSRSSFTLAGFGLLLIAVCDSFYVHANLSGEFVVGDGFWQAGYTVGFLLITASALTFSPFAARADGEAASHLGLWTELITYAPLFVAAVVAGVLPLGWQTDPVLVVLAVTTLVLATIRQLLVLADAAVLRTDLERIVVDRTAEFAGSQTRLRAITQTAADAIVVTDVTGRIRAWNAGACRLFGKTEADVLGRQMAEFVVAGFHVDDAAGLTGRAADARRGAVSVVEVTARHADGREMPVEMSLTSWSHEGETFFTGILRDISERRRAEELSHLERAHTELLQRIAVAANEAAGPQEALRDALALVAGYLGWSLGHAFLVTDGDDPEAPLISVSWHLPDDGRYDGFVVVSEAISFKRGVGLPGQVIASAGPVWLAPVVNAPNFPRAPYAAAAGLQTFCGFPLRSRDTIVGVVEFFSTDVVQPESSVLELMDHVGTQLGRVVERERSERRLTHLAMHDPLTDLANRVVFHDHLELFLSQAARRRTQVAVLLLDLDGFKEVNDSFGHVTGDALLVEVGRRLAAVTRSSDSVARLGGDEFAIAMGDVTSPAQAEAHAARVLDILLEPVVVQHRRLRVAGSVGIALSSDTTLATTAEELLRNADLAMYSAKAAGKSRVAFFDPQMHRDVLSRLELEVDLERAVDADELCLVYQPIVAASGAICSREALVRWRHPARGLVAPNDFIPVAEGSGLIERIGAWVLERACTDAVAWQAAGETDVNVSVNLSARELRAGLIDVVRDVLDRTGLPATSLILEITESLIMDGSVTEAACLLELHGLGVRLSVDDFGTGHSSLARLRSLPVQELKIDRSFVTDLPQDRAAAAMVDAVIAMARALDREVVAEGVETAEQLAFLTSRGCHRVQGFLIGRPVPVEDRGASHVDLAALHVSEPSLGLESFEPAQAGGVRWDDYLDGASFADTVRPVLARLQLATSLESIYVTRIDWDNGLQQIDVAHNAGALHVAEGGAVAWSDTLCRQALMGRPWATHDVLATYEPSEAATRMGIRSFVSVPLGHSSTEIIGTLCGASSLPQPQTAMTVTVMELFAQLISEQMAPRRQQPA